MSQFNIIKLYTIFTQQQDTNSIQVPIDYNPVQLNISRNIKQGVKVSWSKGIKIIQSILLSLE